MLRKLALATVAAAALGTAALAPTAASADWDGRWHEHHHWGGWWGGPRAFYGGPSYSYYGGYGGYGGCVVRRWVPTPWGPRPLPTRARPERRHSTVSPAR